MITFDQMYIQRFSPLPSLKRLYATTTTNMTSYTFNINLQSDTASINPLSDIVAIPTRNINQHYSQNHSLNQTLGDNTHNTNNNNTTISQNVDPYSSQNNNATTSQNTNPLSSHNIQNKPHIFLNLIFSFLHSKLYQR